MHNRRLGEDVPARTAVWSGSPVELFGQLAEQTSNRKESVHIFGQLVNGGRQIVNRAAQVFIHSERTGQPGQQLRIS